MAGATAKGSAGGSLAAAGANVGACGRAPHPALDIRAMPTDGAASKSSPRRKSPDGGERREHPATPARQAREVMGGEELGPGRVGLVNPLR